MISRGEKVAAMFGNCNLGKIAVFGSEADATVSPYLTQSSIYRMGRDLTKASENPGN